MPPRALSDIEGIVQAGNCTGCGLCESIAGTEHVEMSMSDIGHLRPRVKQPLREEARRKILAACPGKQVVGPSADQLSGSARGFMHPVFGPLRSWHRGWSADDAVRWQAAAGGSLTALASFLLETGRVQRVLQVRASQADPTTTDALVSASPADVLSGCQSRYGPSAPLVHVCRLLDEGVVFALVGKPCDISAVRALGKVDPRVQRQIPYMLSIFCGGVPTREAALKIAAHHLVDERDIGVCRFRGHGWPGLMTIGSRKTGEEHGTTYNETWRWSANPLGPDAGIAKYDLQWRCKVCPDAIGEAADVACPDGWLYDEHKKCYVSVDGDDLGQNLVLARTTAGEALVKDCVAMGKLVVSPLQISELEQMHSDHLPRKCSWPLRVLSTWLVRQPARLTVANYRPLASLWWALRHSGLGPLVMVLRGTLQRLLQGANLEEGFA